MAKSNLDTTKLYVDLDDLNPRSIPTDDTLADLIVESPSGVYTTAEITIDANNKKIFFKSTANNSFRTAGSGITGQALYSFLKYAWKNVSSITRFDFPMLSITNEQFEFINSWYLDDTQSITQSVRETAAVTITSQNTITTTDTTVDFRKFEPGDTINITGTSHAGGINGTVDLSTKTTINVTGTPFTNTSDESTTIESNNFTVTSSQLLRTAGWTVKDSTDSYVKEYYAGTITLGSLVDTTDQPYYVQQDANTAPIRNLTYTGPANEAVVIRSVADSTTSTGNSLEDITFTATGNLVSVPTNIDATDLSVFQAGDKITVSGTSSNNRDFTILSVANSSQMVLKTAPVNEGPVGAVIDSDRRTAFKLFVRERGKTYSQSELDDIGVSTMTYIVYRYPVSNATDLKITSTADTDIDADGAVPASVNPYDDIQISYLVGTNGPYVIKGTVTAGSVALDEVYKDTAGRWFKVTAAGTVDASGVADYTANGGTATLAAYEGERYVSTAYYAFNVIIDANDNHANVGGTTPYVDGSDNTTVEQVYEFAQWGLRRTGKINEGGSGSSERQGNIADLLVDFVGDTLVTRAGVFVDSIAGSDQNSIQFTEVSSTDYTGSTNLTYPRVVTVTVNFNTNLSEDGDGRFYVYYTTTPQNDNFGSNTALQVVDSDGNNVGSQRSPANDIPSEADVSNSAGEGSFFNFSYDYDGDTTGGRTVSTDVGITAVALGLNTGQYVKATGTISSTGGTVSLVAPLERNYNDPA